MDDKASASKKLGKFTLNQIFLGILVFSILLGAGAGYVLASSKTGAKLASSTTSSSGSNTNTPQTASADKSTFKDFAEGTIQKKDAPKDGEYSEGTHVLIRTGAVPVALTSSVVDLSQYEGKHVVVYGQTQKAIKEGWLMDVGLVEVK